MIVASIFGFVVLLIAMGIAPLIGIPVWIAFITLIVVYLIALAVVIYRNSWTYQKRHNQ